MSIVKRQIIEIFADQLSGTDRMFGSMMKLDVENIPSKFRSAFDKTKEAACRHYSMKAIYKSFEIESIDDECIRLKNGIVLESKLMAELFQKSYELVFIVVTLYGYEELDEAEDNMILKLFLDNWGTAFIEGANAWVEKYIAKELEDKGIYCTHSFSPGQNDIPLDMQAQIFQALNPGEIGVTLNNRFMMHPKKSVSGIFGLQTERDENGIRPCDLCERKATCPTAYITK